MSGGGEGAQALARTLHSPVGPAKAGAATLAGVMLGGHRAPRQTLPAPRRRLLVRQRIRTSEFALAAGAKALREDILALTALCLVCNTTRRFKHTH